MFQAEDDANCIRLLQEQVTLNLAKKKKHSADATLLISWCSAAFFFTMLPRVHAYMHRQALPCRILLR